MRTTTHGDFFINNASADQIVQFLATGIDEAVMLDMVESETAALVASGVDATQARRAATRRVIEARGRILRAQLDAELDAIAKERA